MSTNPAVADASTHELERVLSAPVAELQERERTAFDHQAGTDMNSLVLFGAGGLGQKTLAGLRQLNISPVAFSDNNRSLLGREVDEIPVLSPEDAAHQFGKTAVFVITIFMDSAPGGIEPLLDQLRGLGCENVISFVPLFWKYPDVFLPHYAYDLPHKVVAAADRIRRAWKLFDDELSQDEFLAQIKWRLDPGFDKIPPPSSHSIYFPPELIHLSPTEVFVDCGAYRGDTLLSFLKQAHGSFQRLLAFEPDPMNYENLSELVASFVPDISNRIQTRELAVGRRLETLHFHAQGVASSALSEQGEIAVRSEHLDLLLSEEKPSFIKMDIEGAEIDALEGALETIRTQQPILAVSAYHRQEHIWEIPLLIHSIALSYRFYLRRYHERVLDDLVLYAIPNNR
jgi:FkbM family methyltransferase